MYLRMKARPNARAIGTAAMAVTLALSASGCGNGGNTQDAGGANLRLAHTASGTNLPVFVAEEKGFFAEQGFKTDLTLLTTTSAAQAPNLVGRQYDVSFATEPVFLNAVRSGLKLEVVGGSRVENSTKEETTLLAAPDSDISTLEDLKDQTVAAPSIGGNLNISTQALVMRAGIDLDDVKFVQLETSNMPDALEAGRVQAAEVTAPVSTRLLAEDYVKLADPISAVADPVHQAMWIADSQWASDNPDLVEKFVAALTAANQWIVDNPDKAMELLIEKSGIPPEFEKDMVMSDYDSHYPPADLEAWAKVITEVEGTQFDLDYESLVAPAAR